MIEQDLHIFNKTKKLENPVTQKPSVAIFTGPTGSGKSTWMLSYLMALEKDNKFQRAIFMSSNKVDPILDNLGDEVTVSNDPEELKDFITEIKRTPKDKIKEFPNIIILDDMQDSPVINIKNNKWLNQFVLSHRHYNTWMIFCTQTWKNSMSSAIRKMGSLLYLFPPRNDGEFKSILEDIPVPKEKLKKAFEIVSHDQQTPLYLNIQQPKARLFKGFRDEIVDFA